MLCEKGFRKETPEFLQRLRASRAARKKEAEDLERLAAEAEEARAKAVLALGLAAVALKCCAKPARRRVPRREDLLGRVGNLVFGLF